MNILQCENCKGFYTLPGVWARLIKYRECTHQETGEHLHTSTQWVAKAMPSLLNDPITIKDIDLSKPVPRHLIPKGFV